MPRENHTRLFLRDDDVGELTPALTGFLDTFGVRGLPVSYQIIPVALTTNCARDIADRREADPDLFEFAQHGLTHGMTIRGREVNYEFGPERSYEEQLKVIQSGQALLRELMGRHFNQDVFTPPQHKYNRSTLLALKAAGVKVLSASNYATSARHRIAYGIGRAAGMSSIGRNGISYHGRVRPDCQLLELSISVGVDDGSVHRSTVDEVMAAIEAARARTPLVGLMFHHQAYSGRADQQFLADLADSLKALPDVSFHLIGDLAREFMPATA